MGLPGRGGSADWDAFGILLADDVL